MTTTTAPITPGIYPGMAFEEYKPNRPVMHATSLPPSVQADMDQRNATRHILDAITNQMQGEIR